jgi:hypothetical protein
MFIQLKNHKAHIFEHNKSDEIASNIFIIHGAGMDHRIGSMIDLSKFNSSHNIYSIDLQGMVLHLGQFFILLKKWRHMSLR